MRAEKEQKRAEALRENLTRRKEKLKQEKAQDETAALSKETDDNHGTRTA